MGEITLPSGKTANVRVADFRDGMRLQNLLIKEGAQEGIKELDIKKLGAAIMSGNLMNAEVDVNGIALAAIGAATSDAVYSALWPCLKQSTIDGQKITEAYFDDVNARGDFYPLAIECVKVNLLPFWQPLFSASDGEEKKGK